MESPRLGTGTRCCRAPPSRRRVDGRRRHSRFYQHEIDNRRVEIAKSVALVASAQQLPSVEALKNFDAIQRMSQPAHADEELLALAPDLK